MSDDINAAYEAMFREREELRPRDADFWRLVWRDFNQDWAWEVSQLGYSKGGRSHTVVQPLCIIRDRLREWLVGIGYLVSCSPPGWLSDRSDDYHEVSAELARHTEDDAKPIGTGPTFDHALIACVRAVMAQDGAAQEKQG